MSADYSQMDPQGGSPQPKRSFLKGLLLGAVVAGVIATVVAVMVVHHHDKNSSDSADVCDSADQRALPIGQQYEMKAMMDTTVDPCDDFYRYACGGWIDRTVLGPNEQEHVVSFSNIGEVVQREVIEVRNERYPIVQNFTNVCNNAAALTTDSLKPYFDLIDANVTDLDSFLRVSGDLQRRGVAYGALFAWTVEQNLHDARTNVMTLNQDGLSFAANAFAAFPSVNYTRLRPAFDALEAAGLVPNATLAFEAVHAVEQFLFQYQSTTDLNNETLWDSEVFIVSPAEFQTQTGLDLTPFFDALLPGRPVHNISVTDYDAWKGIAAGLFKTAGSALNPSTAKVYLKWRVVLGSLRFLPAAFEEVADAMGEWAGSDGPYPWPSWPLEVTEPDQFRGVRARVPPAFKKPHMRNHRGRGMSSEALAAMGARFSQWRASAVSRGDFCDALSFGMFGTWYMHQYLLQDFPTFDKDLAERLVSDTISHLRQRLQTVDWLDEPTRQAALEKLAQLVPNVANDPFEGAPDVTVDWTATPFEVFRTIAAWRFEHGLQMMDTEFNRHGYQGSPFEMAPWVQNAYYQPTSNTINLLPGLMLPPMFGPDMPYSLNVASYIMVIGHECTHGYDNSGRLFGPYGAYVNWWTDAAVAEFNKRTQCLVDQYSEFEAFGIHVNGSQTLGENIADGGGVDMAWSVYKSIDPPPREGMLEGFTNDQLHFLWYAQTWCTKLTQEAYEDQVKDDVHSPDQFRIRGPLSNFRPFAEAFKCRADQYYGRSLTDKACVVW